MNEIVIHGIPGSPYMRSALIGLHEKQAPFRLQVVAAGTGRARTEEHLGLHPFGRVPIIEHGDFRLYETQAILRYIDTVFPGVSLQPQDARAAARMNQIVNIVDWYVFPSISVGISAERIMAERFWGRPTDEANIAKALPQARTCIRELLRLKGSAAFLAGDSFSIADCMAAPHLLFFRGTPEAQMLLAGTPLDEWLTRMRARASFAATEVERLRQAA